MSNAENPPIADQPDPECHACRGSRWTSKGVCRACNGNGPVIEQASANTGSFLVRVDGKLVAGGNDESWWGVATKGRRIASPSRESALRSVLGSVAV